MHNENFYACFIGFIWKIPMCEYIKVGILNQNAKEVTVPHADSDKLQTEKERVA